MFDGMEVGWRDTMVLMPGPDGVCSVSRGRADRDANGGSGGDDGFDGDGGGFDGGR